MVVIWVSFGLVLFQAHAPDINRACRNHGGVAGVYSRNFLGTTGTTYAICADRIVHRAGD